MRRRLSLAEACFSSGQHDEAVSLLTSLLESDPEFLDAYLLLAALYSNCHRWAELAELCTAGIACHPEQPELFKFLIKALSSQSLNNTQISAMQHFALERLDTRPTTTAPNDLLCFSVLRNERTRLPFFLRYYRELGVDRFYFIDNASSDGSREWLLQQPDVHLWTSALSFGTANFGSAWFEILMQAHAEQRWCVMVDLDEFIVFEGAPKRTLKEFCGDLTQKNQLAATGLMIDCYSDRPLRETHYQEGDSPFVLCPFIDRKAFHNVYDDEAHYGNQQIYFGGLRDRVFPEPEFGYILNKSVVIFYQDEVVLTPGQHLTNIAASHIADRQLAVMHFKYFSSLVGYAESEASREEHAKQAIQYKTYHAAIADSESFTLFDADISVRYQSAAQLVELGAMEPEV